MSRTKRRKLSPANLEIMKVVWEREEVSVNDVVDSINAGRSKKLRRTTIQVQMNRLEEYGWLQHRKQGRTFFYSASSEKQKARREILDDITERVFSGSRSELVRCLIEDSDISAEEISDLRKLLKSTRDE